MSEQEDTRETLRVFYAPKPQVSTPSLKALIQATLHANDGCCMDDETDVNNLTEALYEALKGFER